MISTQVLKLLVKYGADIDAVCEDEDIPTVEAHADMALGHPLPHQFDWSWHYWVRLPGVVEGTLAFFRDYRAAGGTWKRYVAEPRKELLVLRKLVEKGRARPPRARRAMAPTGLFARDGLPDVLFWKVLAYWRSERDV